MEKIYFTSTHRYMQGGKQHFSSFKRKHTFIHIIFILLVFHIFSIWETVLNTRIEELIKLIILRTGC